MSSVVAAFLAVCLYYVGAAFLKAAAAHMEPLQGTRPGHLLGQALRSPVWLTGLCVFVIGLELQIVAFAELPLGLAQPLYSSTLLLLVGITVGYFRERLVPREWLGLGLFALAEVMIAASVLPGEDSVGRLPATPALLAVAVPSLALPPALFWLAGRPASGRHARRQAGIVYGLCCGILVGIGEVAVKGLAIVNGTRASGLALLAEPYPYLIAASVALSLAVATVSLQRCRMAICIAVCTIVTKTYLVVVGMLLYGDWPAGPGAAFLRLAGIAVAICALFAFPRYDGWGRSSSATTSRAVSTAGSVPPR